MDISNTKVWYQLVNAKSNRMLEVPQQSTLDARLQNEVLILQGDPYVSSSTDAWSLWQFANVPTTGGYDIYNQGSGRCLVIQNGGNSNGDPAWQYSAVPQRDQERWLITDAGNGNVWLQNALSGLYLEIENGGMSKGDKCQQWGNTPPNYLHGQWQLKATTIATVPELTKVKLDNDKIHNNGKSTGTVHGDNLLIGCSVLIQKGNAIKTWTGTITDNHSGNNLTIYWTFTVQKKSGGHSPIEEDTITGTVTNPQPQTSTPPQPANPQPQDVP